jgi:hypothetical protein
MAHIESVQSEDSNFFNKDMLAYCHLLRADQLSLQDLTVYKNHFEEYILPLIDGIDKVRNTTCTIDIEVHQWRFI